MQLLWSSSSPIVRKAWWRCMRSGVADGIVTGRVAVSANKPNAAVMALNPREPRASSQPVRHRPVTWP